MCSTVFPQTPNNRSHELWTAPPHAKMVYLDGLGISIARTEALLGGHPSEHMAAGIASVVTGACPLVTSGRWAPWAVGRIPVNVKN